MLLTVEHDDRNDKLTPAVYLYPEDPPQEFRDFTDFFQFLFTTEVCNKVF